MVGAPPIRVRSPASVVTDTSRIGGDEGVVVVGVGRDFLGDLDELPTDQIEDLDVAVRRVGPPSRHHDELSGSRRGRGERVHAGRSDSFHLGFAAMPENRPEDAPPPVVGLPMEKYGRLVGERRPTAVVDELEPAGPIGRVEEIYIGGELVNLPRPPSLAGRRHRRPLAGRRNGRAEIRHQVGRQPSGLEGFQVRRVHGRPTLPGLPSRPFRRDVNQPVSSDGRSVFHRNSLAELRCRHDRNPTRNLVHDRPSSFSRSGLPCHENFRHPISLGDV
uniref:Uncharacterized protein n=1 Tax=Nymphaea colorata TaxID=210225 RepID=A0A5K0Z247_9MAGN